MKFCVRYRTKEGHLTSMTVEAESRAGVFAELSRRGVSVVSVSEGEAKPDKRKPSRKPVGPKGGLWCWGIGIAALVAVGVGVLMLFQNISQKDNTVSKPNKDVVAQNPRKPGVKPGSDGEAVTPIAQDVSQSDHAATTNDVASTEPKTPKKKFRVIRKDEGKKKLFHNIADIYISRVVNSQPGNLVVGTINYDRFPEQFRKALNDPITIDKDDTPEEVAKKQAVIETRAELKKMLDDGVDIAQVMREAEAESRRLWNYRRSLHLELANAVKEGKFNADDMQDYVDAANMMLKDNGMEPLKYPQFWVRRMRQQEAESASGN